jgi:CHAT domain-containing protein
MRKPFFIAPYVTFKHNSSSNVRELYSALLFSKGMLLNSSIELQSVIAESGNELLEKQYRDLQSVHHQIDKRRENMINADSLMRMAEDLEYILIRDSKSYGDYTRNLKLLWEDVQNELSDNDIAIEFVDFSIPGADSTMYAALLLRKGWDAPKMMTLFEKSELEKLIAVGDSKLYGGYIGKQITTLIWEPLEEYLNEGDNVYFSPSGVLHHLAIESLPTEDNRLMSERYNLYRLSSTKQLCYDHPVPKYDKAVLYGGLTYDLDEETMVAESRAYRSTRDLYAMRGFETDSFYRDGWNALPGTKREVENISTALASADIQNSLFEGQAGNEESFRTLSGQKNRIIHIATHGFFLPLEKARHEEYFRPVNDNVPEVDNSMRRSGLMLAGGNRAWRGEPVPDGVEDGVLTSQEIVSLDLRGADLVVLSACETGLGEVTGEGVFGLQRAFKKAGAQTLIMSLWRVSDAATEVMMSEIYANLLAGKSKRESFLTAQAAVRKKFAEPYYWAAFIMLD